MFGGVFEGTMGTGSDTCHHLCKVAVCALVVTLVFLIVVMLAKFTVLTTASAIPSTKTMIGRMVPAFLASASEVASA